MKMWQFTEKKKVFTNYLHKNSAYIVTMYNGYQICTNVFVYRILLVKWVEWICVVKLFLSNIETIPNWICQCMK